MKKTKRSKKSKSWGIKQHRDQFYKKSKTLGYRSRSAFKLIELDEKFKFIKNNSNLVDIGASPGGWSQVASKKIQQGRLSKGWTQKQLATKLSIPVNVINEMECGKFIHDGQKLSKVKRALNIK